MASRKVRRKITSPSVPVAGRDYTLNLPKGHLSFSQIDLYQQCPTKYEYVYVQGHRTPYTAALAEGQAFARTIEKASQHWHRKGKHLSLDAVCREHATCLRAEWKKLKNSEEDIADAQDRGLLFLTTLWGPDESPDIEPIVLQGRLGVEWEVDMEIAGVPIKGYIDLIEADQVSDWKVARSAKRYNVEKSLQLDLYVVATGISCTGFRILEKDSGNVVPLWSVRNIEQVRRWCEITVARTAFAISMGVFPPCKPGEWFCSAKWCSFYGKCYGG